MLGLDPPQTGCLVVTRGDIAGVKGKRRAQIKPVGHVFEVAQNFRLSRKTAAPGPFLFQFFGAGIGVDPRLGVSARARITIPVPDAAYAVALLKGRMRKPHLAQLVHRVDAACDL